jgi:hypothetical protein
MRLLGRHPFRRIPSRNFGRSQHGNIFGLLHVSDKAVAFIEKVIVSRRDFDDPGFNLDNGKGKVLFLNSLMSGYTELIEISDCRPH